MTHREVAAVILAAGAGTRMKSELPKVLHPVCGVPMLGHVLGTVGTLGIRRKLVIAGHLREQVKAYVENFDKRAEVVTQWPPRGTGHALLQTRKQLRSYCGSVLVLCGDAPLIRTSSLESLIRFRQAKDAACVILTFTLQDPTGYGRIIRDARGKVVRIVEQLSASPQEQAVREVNSGVYCFDAKALYRALDRVKPDPIKNEIYLTDAVAILAREGRVEAIETDTPTETLGVNTRKDLAEVTKIHKTAILEKLMSEGVTIEDPATTFIGEGVKIGADTVIRPNTVIDGPAVIGRKCSIGPFARIRAGVRLGNEVTVGNFVEVVRSTVGDRTLVKHLTYLGDTTVGADTNIGAGTITANFDGKNKHRTVIGRGVKVGSGTVFVAPVNIGDKSVTGAGAVVTRGTRVKPGETVVGVPAKVFAKRKRK